MLGLLLIYYIGKQFYNLAGEHNKSQWGFAIIGIVSYYGGTILVGLIFGIIDVIRGVDYFTSMNDIVINLMALPFGVLTCWGLYKILNANWSKKKVVSTGETLDSNVLNMS